MRRCRSVSFAWRAGLGTAGAVAIAGALKAFGTGGSGQPITPVGHVVAYAIDPTNDQLVRYAFGDSEYVVLGQVRDQNGNTVHAIKSLAWIPYGPYKGLYGCTNYPSSTCRLLRFNPLEGSAVVHGVDIGFRNVEGMVAHRDPASDQWTLLAVQSNGNLTQVQLCHYPPGNPGNQQTITVAAAAVNTHLNLHGDMLGACPGDHTTQITKNLISIDPGTGLGTVVAGLGARFEGLAEATNGVLYATRGKEVWKINPSGSPVLTLVGAHNYGNVRALEFAYGDGDPGLVVPGVPESWTAGGALFGFSDDANSAIVIDPATGAAIPLACPLGAVDVQGLVFMTMSTDPFNVILAGPCD